MAAYPPFQLDPWYTELKNYIDSGDGHVDGYDVILLAGQSNMVGLGTPVDTTYLDDPDPRIHQWAGSGTYLGQNVLAVNPLAHHGPHAGVGPGLEFAKWWVRSTGRNVLLVPTAHGATGFTTTSVSPAPSGYHTVLGGGSWDRDATDGGTNLYDFAVEQTNAAIASNENNVLVAILWQQGSADGAFVSGDINQAQYQTLMNDLVTNFRADLTGGSEVPFLVGRETPDWYVLHSGDLWTDWVHLNMPVENQLVEFAMPTPVLGGTEGDNIHINAVWQRQAGRVRYPEAYELALVNVLGTQPVPPTDMTFTQSGTTVTLGWTRGLGRNTDYVVEKDTGSGFTNVTRTTEPTDPTQPITGLTLGATVDFRVSAVNEEATSVPLEGSYTLQDVPDTPTGLDVTPSAWSVLAFWDAVADADEYLLEYKATASGTWLSAGTTTDTSLTVGSLLPSTSYDFRVSASNSAGTSAVSSTHTESTTTPTYLAADVGTDPLWAYSVRKIRSGYAGSCLRVRRSSDSTQQDIGFDGNGLLDTTALLAFVGAGSGFVAKWYNQGTAGSSADIANATAGAQPRIVNAGVVDTKNSLPTVVFDGTNDFLTHASPALLASADGVTVMNVAQTRKASSILFGELTAAGNTCAWLAFYSGPGLNEYIIITNDLGEYLVVASSTSTFTDDDTLHQETALDTLTTVQQWRDATSVIGPKTYARNGSETPTLVNVGVSATPAWHQGGISELVFWTTALTDMARTSGQSNQAGYYGTP